MSKELGLSPDGWNNWELYNLIYNCCCLFCDLGFSLTGLARGGQQVTKCKEMFGKAVELLVQLASLQVSKIIWRKRKM